MQNFRAKPTIPLADAPEPDAIDLARTIAVARLVLDLEVSVQAPPNLSPDDHRAAAARRDQRLGRHLARHARLRESRGALAARDGARRHLRATRATRLAPRLPIYPRFVSEPGWLDPALRPRVHALASAQPRRSCRAGGGVLMSWFEPWPDIEAVALCDDPVDRAVARATPAVGSMLDGVLAGRELTVAECEHLLGVDGRRSGRAGARGRHGRARATSATRSPTSSTATSTSPTSAS